MSPLLMFAKCRQVTGKSTQHYLKHGIFTVTTTALPPCCLWSQNLTWYRDGIHHTLISTGLLPPATFPQHPQELASFHAGSFLLTVSVSRPLSLLKCVSLTCFGTLCIKLLEQGRASSADGLSFLCEISVSSLTYRCWYFTLQLWSLCISLCTSLSTHSYVGSTNLGTMWTLFWQSIKPINFTKWIETASAQCLTHWINNTVVTVSVPLSPHCPAFLVEVDHETFYLQLQGAMNAFPQTWKSRELRFLPES